MADSDIVSTLGIWWAEITEQDILASQLKGPLNLSFIAEYEGTLVGFILAKLEYAGFPMTGAAVVFLVDVHPEYQERGIGTMLIKTLEKYAITKGTGVIRAILPQSDSEIISYFTKVGFSQSAVVNYDKVCRS
jgi:ribosomal protein S18 acetylase RimI-like enzyme